MAARTGEGETPLKNVRVKTPLWNAAGAALKRRNSSRAEAVRAQLERAAAMDQPDSLWADADEYARRDGYADIDDLMNDLVKRWVRRRSTKAY